MPATKAELEPGTKVMGVAGIPKPILEDMRKTLLSVAPILVCEWTVSATLVEEYNPDIDPEDAVACGCLMMDGHVETFFANNYSSERYFLVHLYQKAMKRSKYLRNVTYRASAERITGYAQAFDQFAMQPTFKDDIRSYPYRDKWFTNGHTNKAYYVLSELGRAVLLVEVRAELRRIEVARRQERASGYGN